MKPVNLLPEEIKAVKVSGGAPSRGMIGGAAAGLVAVVGIAGYFAMARVDSVKSEADLANARSAQATQQAAAIQSQIQSLGQPVVDSDRQLAQGAEQVLVSAYTERHDFVLMSSELQGITDSSGWIESVTAATSSEDGGKSVRIEGYFPTKELAASYNERVNSTRTLENAEAVSIKSERRTDTDTKRPGVYYRFVVTADFVDTIAPASGGSAGSTDAGLVSDGGGELVLSLDSEPGETKAKSKKPAPAPKAEATPAKPKNPFEVAATAANGGGA